MSRLLRTYREDILEMQLLQERIAWSAVDLYAIAAVLAKLQASLDAAGGALSPQLRTDLLVGKRFCHHAAERVTARLHGLFANKDDEVLKVADSLLGWQDDAAEK